MKLVAMIVISAFFGAGAAVATEEVQESRAQEILLTRIEGQRRIAEIQLQMAQVNYQEIQGRVTQGLMDEEALLGAGVAVRQGEHHLQRLELDREEILLSGQPPQDNISAPRIGKRDFVTERLELEQSAQNLQAAVIHAQISQLQERVALGLVHEEELVQARRAMGELQTVLHGFTERMELRERFLSGEISALEAEAQQEVEALRIQLQNQQVTLQSLAQRLAPLTERVEAGLQTESELTRLKLQLLQVGMEVETLRKTLELLEASRTGSEF